MQNFIFFQFGSQIFLGDLILFKEQLILNFYEMMKNMANMSGVL
jgi:hypothetical protein